MSDKQASLVVHDAVSSLKGLTGPLDSVSILAIDGAQARAHDQSFSVGGHHYIYPWIPEDEIWIEAGLTGKDLSAIIVHELSEREMMKRLNMEYEEAHKVSNTCEEAVRILLGKDDGETSAILP
jgi:hypothetical protein